MDDIEAKRGASVPVVGNMSAAARAAGCRLPKMRLWISDHPQSPAIIRAGHQGLEWRIDIGRLLSEMRGEKDAARRAMAKHTAELDVYKLPFNLAEVDRSDAGGMSATDALKISRARLQNHKLRREMGLLVEASEVRAKGTAMFAKLGTFFDGLPALIGRQHGLPDSVTRAIKAQLDDQRRQFVRELQVMFENDDDEDGISDGHG